MEVVIKWKIHGSKYWMWDDSPEVLANMGINSSKYLICIRLGADRFSLLQYGIDDIRSLYTPDIRMIKQI